MLNSRTLDPAVEEVELIEVNPGYAWISFPDGSQSTVATKHLVPKGNVLNPYILWSAKKIKKDCLITLHGHLNQRDSL